MGSRNESDDPGAWTEPRQAPVLRSMEQVADVSAFVQEGTIETIEAVMMGVG